MYLEYHRLRHCQAQNALRELIGRYGKDNWTATQKADIERAVKTVDLAKKLYDEQVKLTEDVRRKSHGRHYHIELQGIVELVKKPL